MNYLEFWTFICYISYSLNVPTVFTQCLYDGGRPPTSAELFVEISNELSNPTSAKNQLMNTLLTVAASKGVLPELASALQPTLLADAAEAANSVSNSINLPPPPGNTYVQDLGAFGQDCSTPNVIPASIQSNPYQGFLQYPNSPEFLQGFSPQMIAGLPFESYFYVPDIPTTQNNQLETPNDMYKYVSSIPELDIATIDNFKTAYLSAINNPDTTGGTITGIPCQSFKQPVVVTSESEYIPPFNIEINVPIPQMPDQMVSRFPNDQSLSSNFSSNPTPPPEYPLPIVISKSKSKSSFKKLLPILLMAMLLDDNDGGCSCQCNSEPNYIPIPYPIPIPVNSPIVYKSKYISAEEDSSEEIENIQRFC